MDSSESDNSEIDDSVTESPPKKLSPAVLVQITIEKQNSIEKNNESIKALLLENKTKKKLLSKLQEWYSVENK